MVREAVRRERPRRRHLRRPAGPEDPARHGSPTGRCTLDDGRASSRSPPATSPATRRSARRRTRACPATSSAGDPILIDDGKVRAARSIEVDGTDVRTQVVVGGTVSNHKGINLPGVAVSRAGAVGEGHRGPALGAAPDASTSSRCRFVRDAADVERRAQDHGRGGRARCPVIAKIEKPQAIEQPRRDRRRRSTASWSPAATSAWSARSRTCRSCRSRSSRWPAATPSRSSSPPRCSSR